MAKAITDTLALEIAKGLIKPDEEWSADHHALFIWRYFRKLFAGYEPEVQVLDKDGKPVAKPTEDQISEAVKAKIKQMGAEWVAMHNNARLAYASNQAKGLAEAKVCAQPKSVAKVVAEFD